MDAIGETFLCPHCGVEVVPLRADAMPFASCPGCGGAMVLAAPEEAVEASRDDELDGLRVRKIASARRADIRTQTYLYVATAGCAAGVVECIYKMKAAGGWNLTRAVCLGIALLAAAGVRFFAGKARAITRELRRPLLPEPVAPPDFSGLGDGSEQAAALERLR